MENRQRSALLENGCARYLPAAKQSVGQSAPVSANKFPPANRQFVCAADGETVRYVERRIRIFFVVIINVLRVCRIARPRAVADAARVEQFRPNVVCQKRKT